MDLVSLFYLTFNFNFRLTHSESSLFLCRIVLSRVCEPVGLVPYYIFACHGIVDFGSVSVTVCNSQRLCPVQALTAQDCLTCNVSVRRVALGLVLPFILLCADTVKKS